MPQDAWNRKQRSKWRKPLSSHYSFAAQTATLPRHASATPIPLHRTPIIRIVIRPNQPLPHRRRIAHQRCDRRIVLLAVLQPADHGAVEAGAFGHVVDAQAAGFAVALERLEGPSA